MHIYGIDIEQVELPCVTMRVHCSKGTYIRTLCDDIGEMLGVGGLMKSLVRTRVSCFELDHALTLAQIEAHRDHGALEEILLPVDGVFSEYPALCVLPRAIKLLQNGNRLSSNDFSGSPDMMMLRTDARFRVYDDDGRFYGIYGWDEARHDFKSIKMFL